MSHTKGPWRVYYDGHSRYQVFEAERGYPPEADIEDNIALISAAPELLEACQGAADMLGKALDHLADLGHGFGTAGTDESANAYRATLAAIAKARNED